MNNIKTSRTRYALLALLASVFSVNACTPRTNSETTATGVSIESLGNEGADWTFQLNNRTPQPVSFRGEDGMFYARPLQGISHLVCRKKGHEGWIADARIAEAGPETVEVAAGKSKKLKVESSFIGGYLGGECQLKLGVVSGGSIDSEIFSPQ